MSAKAYLRSGGRLLVLNFHIPDQQIKIKRIAPMEIQRLEDSPQQQVGNTAVERKTLERSVDIKLRFAVLTGFLESGLVSILRWIMTFCLKGHILVVSIGLVVVFGPCDLFYCRIWTLVTWPEPGLNRHCCRLAFGNKRFCHVLIKK